VDLCLIAEQSFWLNPESWISMAKMAIGLGFVIFVHELGHFLVAKACGVKCEKFYIGFDAPIHIGPIKLPTTLFKRQWGETEYGIGIIPLGGYVKMLGQDDNPSNSETETDRTKIEKTDDTTGETTVELDPRSYTAKSVPQRMAIISAGVVMNLIFAVIFAAVAFRSGVSYTPCVVGATVPGSPAWELGLEPGDKLIRIGKNGTTSEHLRFFGDLLPNVVINGADDDIEFTVQHRDGSTEDVVIRPRENNNQEPKRPTIGVRPSTTQKLAKENFTVTDSPAANAVPAFEANDKVVALNGTHVADAAALRDLLAHNADKELTITVERKSDSSSDQMTTAEVAVKPNRLRQLGLHLEMGPIISIQNGSPADEYGIKVGDTIVSVDGVSTVNPITLPNRLRRLAREARTVEIGVRRGSDKESEPITIQVSLREPSWFTEMRSPGEPMSSASLGIAYTIKNNVVAVEPGSPAAEAGMLAGDVLQMAQFVPSDEEAKEKQNQLGLKYGEIPLSDEELDWPFVSNMMQWYPADTKVSLKYHRDRKVQNAQMPLAESSEWFFASRGLVFTGSEEIHRVDSIGAAMTLGVRETKESAVKVLGFLNKLVTGKMSPKNLGGPGTIAVVATMEASQGTARLLIFLTMLSANLAVINFMPIPVLDGGHMVFLTFEAIRGRPVDEKWAFRLTMVGLSFILALMVFVIGMDVARFVPWPF